MINATGVWTDDTQALAGERGQFHVRASQGHPPRRAARPDPARDTGLILRTEKTRAVRHPVGPALDHRHHRHRLGRWTRPTRPRAAADIDYLLEHVNAVLDDAAEPRATSRASTRGCGRCCPGESEATSKLSREHAVAHAGAGAGRGRRRQVHDVPGDGQGRRRRGGARASTPRCPPSVHRATCRCSAPRATRRCGTSAHQLAAALRAARGARSSTCCDRYGSLDRRAARPDRGRPDAGRAAGAARRTTCGPRSSTRPSHEGARHLDDVLARRTRISIETFDRGIGVVRGGRAADGAGPRLERRRRSTREVEHYRSGSTAERESQTDARRRDRRRRADGRPRRGATALTPSHPRLHTPKRHFAPRRRGAKWPYGVRSAAGLPSTPWGI